MVYLILGIFVIIQLLITFAFYKTNHVTSINFNIKPEDLWPINGEDDAMTNTGPDFTKADIEILSHHINSKKEANAKLKAAAKSYKINIQ